MAVDLFSGRLRKRLRERGQAVEDLFRAIDIDGSGAVSVNEFKTAVRSLDVPMTDAMARRVAAVADTDGSGQIDVGELASIFADKAQQQRAGPARGGEGGSAAAAAVPARDQMALETFTRRLRRRLADRGETVKTLFSSFDADNSGAVSYDEFKMALRHLDVPVTERLARTVAGMADTDGSGEVDVGEFQRVFETELRAHPEPPRDRERDAMVRHRREQLSREQPLGPSALVNSPMGSDTCWGSESLKYIDQHIKGRGAARRDAGGAGHDSSREPAPSASPGSQAGSRFMQGDTSGLSEESKVVHSLILKKLKGKTGRLRAAMRSLDGDRDGVVTYHEFVRSLRKLGLELSTGQLWTMLDQYDHIGHGVIDYFDMSDHLDVLTGMSGPKRATRVVNDVRDKVYLKSSNLIHVFKEFDHDADGLVSYPELRQALERLGVPLSDMDFEALVSVADADGDGEINYLEFSNSLDLPSVLRVDPETAFQRHVEKGGHPKETPSDTYRRQKAAQHASHENIFGTTEDVSFRRPVSELSADQRKERVIKQKIHDRIHQKGTELRHVFNALDADKDGSLSRGELREGLTSLGIFLSDDDFNVLMKGVDNSSDGRVQYSEFADAMHLRDGAAHTDFSAAEFKSGKRIGAPVLHRNPTFKSHLAFEAWGEAKADEMRPQRKSVIGTSAFKMSDERDEEEFPRGGKRMLGRRQSTHAPIFAPPESSRPTPTASASDASSSIATDSVYSGDAASTGSRRSHRHRSRSRSRSRGRDSRGSGHRRARSASVSTRSNGDRGDAGSVVSTSSRRSRRSSSVGRRRRDDDAASVGGRSMRSTGSRRSARGRSVGASSVMSYSSSVAQARGVLDWSRQADRQLNFPYRGDGPVRARHAGSNAGGGSQKRDYKVVHLATPPPPSPVRIR